MSKKIDLNQSVYDITKTYPEVIDIMVNLGFAEIKKPAMLNSVGRIMTIPKGAKSKGISIPVVIAELIKNGFEITGNMPDISSMASKEFQVKETGNTELLKEWIKRVQAVLTRADEMIYKEANILFPICAVNFTVEEWYGIYEDAKDYTLVYSIENRWEEAEKYIQDKKNRHEAAIYEGEIVMGGGHMSVAQLEAMLNTLPIEITFVDDNNINRYFNEGAKVFKRPGMAIDREVFSCHPPKIEPMVRSIIESFKNHTMDSVPVWMEKQGKPFLVTYYAVRDKNDIYLGTVEVVQDMQFAKEHFTSIHD